MLKILKDVGFGSTSDASPDASAAVLLTRDLSTADFSLPAWFEIQNAEPIVDKQARAHSNGEAVTTLPRE
jgi:hypothetical protein